MCMVEIVAENGFLLKRANLLFFPVILLYPVKCIDENSNLVAIFYIYLYSHIF